MGKGKKFTLCVCVDGKRELTLLSLTGREKKRE